MSNLVFKILGSGYLILLPANNLPKPYDSVQYGMIDREVDGLWYWSPDKKAISDGSVFPAWILHDIAAKIDQLNLVEACNESAAVMTAERSERLRAVFDVEGKKPYSMEELEATKYTGGHIDIDQEPGTCYPA